MFSCGLEGSEGSRAQAVEALVLDTLRDVAENGVPIEQVRAVLHQLELHQREIGGDGYPFGLQLLLMAMSGAVHRGDPVAVLNLEPVLEKLHRDIEDPDYVKRLVRELLLDNPHRVRLVMNPDTQLAARRRGAEEQQLAAIRATLDEDACARIVETATTLAERQNQRPDDSCLPRVTIADVPLELPDIESWQVEGVSQPATRLHARHQRHRLPADHRRPARAGAATAGAAALLRQLPFRARQRRARLPADAGIAGRGERRA